MEADEFPEVALFEPHVRSGLLIERTLPDTPFATPVRGLGGRVFEGVRQVFYARPGEEWRIDTYLLVWRQLAHGPWNDTLERLEGSLLGYTDAERLVDQGSWQPWTVISLAAGRMFADTPVTPV